jgi:hypothetical protein
MTDASGSIFPEFVATEPAEGGLRGRKRDSLFLVATLRRIDTGSVVQTRVRNLSEGGLMAEGVQPMEIGTPVTVDIRGIGEVRGRIAWYTEQRAGVAFDTRIDPQRARKPVGLQSVKRD